MAAALALSCALLLTGCSSLLENPYAVVEPHTERPATAEDSSAVQAGTYSELVNTVLFFVSQGTEKGLIQLTDDYDGDVEEDLNRACLEVIISVHFLSDIPILPAAQSSITET